MKNEDLKDQNQGGASEEAISGGEGVDFVKENQALKAELENSKSKISELGNTVKTLETRLNEVFTPKPQADQARLDRDDASLKEAEEVISEAIVGDQKTGAKKLLNLIEKASQSKTGETTEAVKWALHVEKVRKENEDLKNYENFISSQAGELIASGKAKDSYQALELAISNFRTEFNKPKTTEQKPEAPKAPAGSQGERDGGMNNAPREAARNSAKDFPESQGESPEDYVKQRKAIFAKKMSENAVR